MKDRTTPMNETSDRPAHAVHASNSNHSSRAWNRVTTPTRGWPISSSGASSTAPGSSSDTSTDLPNPGSRIVGSVGTQGGRRRSRRGRQHPRAPQHLPPSRHPPGRRPGEEKALRCPYHGWTYHLDGTLVGAPENRTIPCLDKSKLSLFGARAEVFCGLIFVNLDPAAEPLGAAARRSAAAVGALSRRRDGTVRRGSHPRRRSTSTSNSRTGRSPSTTTSRATTCRSRIPG